LSVYAFETTIWIRYSGQPFTCYRASRHAKYPYFYPVAGPVTGLPMTQEAGDPFPHHRSLFLGCDRVNGGNYWQEGIDRGQILSRGPGVEAQSSNEIVITDTCDWRRPGHEGVITDRRRWTISAPNAEWRIIDADIVLEAGEEVRIAKSNHSLFSLRADHGLTPAGGGVLQNSEGQTGERATFGQPARWCGFSGQRLGRRESIVLMDHPKNPWPPCPWFTRDYGMISPTPMNWIKEDWVLPAGDSVQLRYRVAVLAAGLDAPVIERLYQAFAA
jgi:hypothetical protein